MSEQTISHVDLSAVIDADDIIRGLKNNDELILSFILQMLDHAGSSELEDELMLRIRQRLCYEPVPVPTPTTSEVRE